MRTKPYYRMIAGSLAILFTGALYGQKTIDQTIKRETRISPGATLTIMNKFADLTIESVPGNTAILESRLVAKARSEDDAEKFAGAFGEIRFTGDPDNPGIDLAFIKSYANIMGAKKLGLSNGGSVGITEFELKHTLKLPEKVSLDINSRYGEIRIPAITGSVRLNTYDGDTWIGNITGRLSLQAKYAKINTGDCEGAEIVLYDCNLKGGITGKLKLESKYSDIEMRKSDHATITSYDDNIILRKSVSMDFTARYSDLSFEESGNAALDLYDCDVKGGILQDLKISSKYSLVQAEKTREINCASSYDDKFTLGECLSFSATESKYTEYEFQKLHRRLILNGYDDNLSVQNLDQNFHEISLNGKYGEFRIGIPGNISFRFKADLKYPKLDLPPELKKSLHQEKSDYLYMEAYYGKPVEGSASITLQGYSQTLSLTKR